MSKYTVDGNLDHNGKVYKTGDSIELDDASAKPLLDINRIVPEVVQEAATAPDPLVTSEQSADLDLQNQPPQSPQPSPEKLGRTAQKIVQDLEQLEQPQQPVALPQTPQAPQVQVNQVQQPPAPAPLPPAGDLQLS